MDILITVEEVQAETGVNVREYCEAAKRDVNAFLRREQQKIINYICNFAYDKMRQVNAYLEDEEKKEGIKKAIIEQVRYIATQIIDTTSFVAITERAGNISVADSEQLRGYDIAPMAADILRAYGLLYTGKRVRGYGGRI